MYTPPKLANLPLPSYCLAPAAADRTGACTVASGYCPVWGASSDSGMCTISVPGDNTASTTNAPPVSINSTSEARFGRGQVAHGPLYMRLPCYLFQASLYICISIHS